MAAKITICLPVLNGEEFLEDALASLERQTFQDFQVIVSDNDSSDGTAAMLDAWRSRLPIEVVRQATRLAMTDNFNSLLARVATKYYMLLCHDDFLASNEALAKAFHVMETQSDLSAIYCDLVYVDAKAQTLATRRFRRQGRLSADELGRQSIRTARNMFGIPLLVRQQDALNLRYDAGLSYVCDIDLSWSVSKAKPLYHLAEPLIANRYTGFNQTWTLLKQAGRQFKLLAAKHGLALSAGERCRLWITSFLVMQQKRIFGLYASYRGSRP